MCICVYSEGMNYEEERSNRRRYKTDGGCLSGQCVYVCIYSDNMNYEEERGNRRTDGGSLIVS